jgi:EAL domain-containing protein (putative c-di-GMP-specific phosphodiesterase class I)
MTVLDRWIIKSSMEFCREHNAEHVFIRLSRTSMQDKSLPEWIGEKVGDFGIEPENIILQIPEQEAARFIKETKSAAEALRKAGIGFALEHYGIDKNRFQILDILKPNFIKIDGELMHLLLTDTSLQESVRALASAATERDIRTIAERVENANAMAVLFQLGVHYMQGHYVHEPEVVLQEPLKVTTTLDAIASK